MWLIESGDTFKRGGKTMYFKTALACLALILVAACEEPDRYPISGQSCAPDDPVQDLTVDHCAPPA